MNPAAPVTRIGSRIAHSYRKSGTPAILELPAVEERGDGPGEIGRRIDNKPGGRELGCRLPFLWVALKQRAAGVIGPGPGAIERGPVGRQLSLERALHGVKGVPAVIAAADAGLIGHHD